MKIIGLGYNNKLMKCCVNIVYTIVIFGSTCVMKIIKGVTVIVCISMYDDDYN